MKTAVCLIIFKRLSAVDVARYIAQCKPPVVYIVADGPRNEIESSVCLRLRTDVEKVFTDAGIAYKTVYAQANLGCKRRIVSGLDHVFQEVERAIILEDDCLPSTEFFQFCDEMLEKYESRASVNSISGANFLKESQVNEVFDPKVSYTFSVFSEQWGWATWRRAWAQCSFELINSPSTFTPRWDRRTLPWNEYLFFTAVFRAMAKNLLKGDIWDYHWMYRSISNGYLSVVPRANLITNIGDDVDATHIAEGNHLVHIPTTSLVWPLVHPQKVVANYAFDRVYRKIVHFRGLKGHLGIVYKFLRTSLGIKF